MTEEQSKRASLKGMGWQIFKGQELPDQKPTAPEETEESALNVTVDEADDLLAIAPPPLSGHDTSKVEPVSMSPPINAVLDKEDFDAIHDQAAMPVSETPVDVQTLDRIQTGETQSIVGELDEQDFTTDPDMPDSKYATLELGGEAIPQLEDAMLPPAALDLTTERRPSRDEVAEITPAEPEVAESDAAETVVEAPAFELPTLPEIDDTGQDDGFGEVTSTVSRDELAALGSYSIDDVPDYAQHRIADKDLAALPAYRNDSGNAPSDKSDAVITASVASEGTPLIESSLYPEDLVDTDVSSMAPPVEEADFDVQERRSELVSGVGGYGPGDFLVAATQAADEILEPASPLGSQERLRATKLFGKPRAADPYLADKLIDNKRILALWNQIEELQEALIDNEFSDRMMTDTYQQELHEASNLLLESRQNYDDARAIVHRVRADINRDRRVVGFIKQYRPRLLLYLALWGIILVVLGVGHTVVEDFARDEGIPFLAEVFLPTIFGAGGGLLTAYLTLDKHTTRRRDFDPIHIPWYLASPVIGGLMGFMMFLLIAASIATTVTQSITAEDALRDWPVVIWILAFVAGMQQNFVLKRLRGNNSSQQDATPGEKTTA